MGGFRYKYIRILSKFLSDCWLCPYSVSMKCLSLNKISTCSQYAPAIPFTISRHTNVQRKERGFLFPLLIFKSKKIFPRLSHWNFPFHLIGQNCDKFPCWKWSLVDAKTDHQPLPLTIQDVADWTVFLKKICPSFKPWQL